MIKRSIRVYSLQEIYQFIEFNDYSQEFLEYIAIAPGHIKELLIKMGVEHQYLSVDESKIEEPLSSDENTINDEPEGNAVPPDIDNQNIMKNADEGNEDKVVQKNSQTTSIIDKPNKQDDEKPYENMRFGDSITVNRLVLHEMKHTSCKIHGKDYQSIRVIVSLPNGEFVVRTKCCPKCKKLFIKKENYYGLKELLERKKVKYVWIPEGE